MDALRLLKLAHDKGASDIHIMHGMSPSLRLHSRLQDVEEFGPLTTEDVLKFVKFVVPDKRFPELDKGDLDLSYQTDFSRFRVNVCRERLDYSATLRLIPEKVPPFSALNIPNVVLEVIKKSQGLILVVGPTGSGKSTTIAALIDYINEHNSYKIVTLEDPIEYVHTNKQSRIIQREIGEHTMSFSSGLRAALRQDPDVISVGEMRDLETISTAITAAETGHLVFGTLHTASSGQTVDRIIDVFPEHQQGQIRFQLATKLSAIISQRLVPREDKPGSVAAFEILRNTNSVSNLIRRKETHKIDNEIRTGKRFGMMMLEDSLADLRARRIISDETVNKFKSDHTEM